LNVLKSWRIHFSWAIVTVLAVAVTTRISTRANPEPPRILPRSAVALLPKKEPDKRDRPSAPLLSDPPVGTPTPESPATGRQTLADQIRAMLKATNAMDELGELLAGVEDRDFKLALMKEALAGPDKQAVYTALFVLRGMKGRDVAEIIESYLVAHLSDETGFVAAYSLGELGDPGSIAALNEALRSGNDEVRLYSAAALLKMGYRAPADQMLADLTRQFESSDGSLRRKAIDRIRQLAPEGGVPVLARALKDSNGDVRIHAIQAFSALGKKEYAALLLPLTNDPNPEVATTAQEVIENLKERP
jgi:HEAT repeat protein